MKAVLANSIGGPEVLQIGEAEKPSPEEDEIIVRIEYAGVNMLDTIERRGMFRVPPRDTPYIPGVEGAGTIEAIGSNVSDYKVGERVSYMDLLSGAYSEYARVASESKIIRIPDDIPSEVAAAMTITGMTSHYLVHEYVDIKPGMNVVVHSAAGGVGSMLTQWLKHYDARVIGTTSSLEKAEVSKANGCDDVILYLEQDFSKEVMRLTDGNGADLILDAVGKPTIPLDLECIGRRGTIVLYGVPGGKPDPVDPFSLMFRRSVRLCGGDCDDWTLTPEETQGRMNDVYEGYRKGFIKPNITEVVPLEEVARVHTEMESRKSSGVYVLKVT